MNHYNKIERKMTKMESKLDKYDKKIKKILNKQKKLHNKLHILCYKEKSGYLVIIKKEKN